MHEMAIADNMLNIVNIHKKKHELTRVSRVRVVVGELTGIVPESLEFCWQVCTEETPIEGAFLEIEKEPALALCNGCAEEYSFTTSLECPKCRGGIERVVSGKELYVDFIEGE